MLANWVRRILQATVYDVVNETPLQHAPLLSSRLGQQVWLKREDLQPVFSFKLRGAYNRISQLSPEQLKNGVICASAGNHAQGVAYSAQYLNIEAVIVMPRTTPPIKIDAVRRLGGEVVLAGDTFDEANRFAQNKALERGMTFVPPYDDELVIAGQGTIAAELVRQCRQMDYVFVAVGGGGLIAGVAAYLAEIAPQTKIIAVESEESACLAAAFATGERVTLPSVGLFADGVAVARIGALPFEVLTQVKADGSSIVEPDVVQCSNDEICAAIKAVYEDCRAIVEPAGALAIAGMKKYCQQYPDIQQKNMIGIICGANMNFDRLRYVAERTELGEQREAIFAVGIAEKTGAFLDFCRHLAGRSITEFNYRYYPDAPNQMAQVYVGIALRQAGEGSQLHDDLQTQGYKVVDLTQDEVAKLHVRHLIGGHAQLNDERLLRFEFPERPGALLTFLEKLGQQFNISLFHYRNHGAAEGRVLAGLQVGALGLEQLHETLVQIGYPFADVTDNRAYRLFLK